jgi:hypothetical protein
MARPKFTSRTSTVRVSFNHVSHGDSSIYGHFLGS